MLPAQDLDLFGLLRKETLRPEFSMNLSLHFSDSIFLGKPVRLDATKEYIPRLGFNYKQNLLLLSFKEDFSFEQPLKISPYLTAPYSNQIKYDLNSTETIGEVITNVVLYPIGCVVLLNPLALFDYLMRIGVLPDEPLVPKKSKKERMLKTITQDVYHIDDNY